MPCAQIKISVALDDEKKNELCVSGCKILAEVIGKPIFYCMCTCEEVRGAMGGTTEPMAFVNIGSIGGLSGSVPRKLSDQFCKLLEKVGIDGERVYLVCSKLPHFSIFSTFFFVHVLVCLIA